MIRTLRNRRCAIFYICSKGDKMLTRFTFNANRISNETIKLIETAFGYVFQKAVIQGDNIVVTFWVKRA